LSLQRLRWQRNLFLVLSGVLILLLVGTTRRHAGKIKSLRFLKQQVEELEQLNQSKNQLFSIIAHDLRSSVHTLQFNISKLRTFLSQVLIRDAIVVAENAERVTAATNSLLNNLLHWSLSQTNQISYHPEPISIQAIINQVCYDLVPIADSKAISLNYTLDEDYLCMVDFNSIKIALRNLVDNAIKFTSANGTVTVSARQEHTNCYITVDDSGVGMDTKIIKTIMNSDVIRIETDTYGRRSTGLGLLLAKSMIEKNGGALFILSEKGIGTSVSFSLQLSD
jgi:signal transduction histidine kinase